MKKLVSILLGVALSLALVACSTSAPKSKNRRTKTETETKTNSELFTDTSTDPKTESNTNNDSQEQPDSYNYYLKFSEGLAWVQYEKDNKTSFGCIDKSGKMVFKDIQCDGVSTAPSPFSNGYSFLTESDIYLSDTYIKSIKVVDKTGKITASYDFNPKTIEKNSRVLAYGDGYVFTEQYEGGFNTTKYTYTIYDPLGQIVTSFENEKKIASISHSLGQGVFAYTEDCYNWNIYFPKTDLWIEYKDLDRTAAIFNQDKCILGTSQNSLQTTGTIGLLRDHWIYEYDVHYPSVGKIENGYCILRSGDKLISYDTTSGTLAALPDEYNDKIEYDKLESEHNLSFTNGHIALPMKGNDGLIYIGIFDTKWNLTCNPIKIYHNDSYAIGDGVLMVYNMLNQYIADSTTVYDFSGNILFETEKTVTYSDGVLCVSGEKTPTYLDIHGNSLFSEIEF